MRVRLFWPTGLPTLSAMSEDAEQFDWGADLSEEEWRALAVQVKASELHLRFAVAIDRGCSAVEAASQAGYTGTRDILKGSGHRAKQSRTVKALLALAERRKAELAIEEPAAPDRETRRRKLGRLVNSKDPRIQQQAIEALNKMDAEDRQMSAAASGELRDPADILKDIAMISPLMAVILAHYGLADFTMPDVDADAVGRWHCAACAEKIVSNLRAAKANPVAALPSDPPFLNGHAMASPATVAEA